MAVRELRIADATPGALYEVTIPGARPPAALAHAAERAPAEGVSLLIGSCFWINDDRDGFYASAVKELVQREKPIFKVLMGDQLYADVWAPLPQHAARGARRTSTSATGATTPTASMLAACPTLVSCDDHEFWNDFPQPQIQVPLSWDRYQPADRQRARRALRRLPERAQPGRQALVLDRRPAGLVLHRRHALAPHARRRPARAADGRGAVGRPRGVGGEPHRARASSSSRSRC